MAKPDQVGWTPPTGVYTRTEREHQAKSLYAGVYLAKTAMMENIDFTKEKRVLTAVPRK
jgi:hypothetical protein